MKNLAIAVSILIIVIIIIFLFASKNNGDKDTLIPTPTPIGSPPLQIINQNKPQSEASLSAGKKTYQEPPPVLTASEIEGKKVRAKTAKGDIVIALLKDAPIAASNFIFLVNDGFYDELTFHRREENFVIQGGDPKGNGTGGPGYTFSDEPVTLEYTRGIVAMANAGPNTNGSQFFIMLADAPNLPKKYTIFGKVIEGMEIVDKIEIGDKMIKLTVE